MARPIELLPEPLGPDHDAEPPVVALDRQLGVEREIGAGFAVEQRLDPRRAVAREVVAAMADFDPHVTTTRTGRRKRRSQS